MSSALAVPLPAISPRLELGAYETLWADKNATFKTIADKFRGRPNALPSDFVLQSIAENFAERALKILYKAGVKRFGVRIHGAGEYPKKLRDADHPIELLYYQGWWDLVDSRSVAVVGTRKPSEEGKRRTAKLARCLAEDNFTVVSGLARGIDTIAHKSAMAAGGRTIAVIGTPLSRVYPSENRELQRQIADQFLLISQVPVYRYSLQGPRMNRLFFPARNVTMSALTLASCVANL